MTSKPYIVYPDADSTESDLNHSVSAEIRRFGKFKLFAGKPTTPKEYIARIESAQGILLGWDLPADIMSEARNLEVISFTGIGADRFIDMDLAKRMGITVCNCPGYSDQTVAEHALGLLFAVTRKIPPLHNSLRHGQWDQSRPGVELAGKTIGLVGFGGIGQAFARMCKAIGMNVKVWTRSMNPDYAQDFDIELCTLDSLVSSSDIVSLHLASNEQTRGIINRTIVDAMKPGAILINTARAELVDREAMLAALESGHIGSAGLDVFHQEPLPPDDPLLHLDNVVLTPHIAYNTPESVERLFQIAVRNLELYFDGKPINVIRHTIGHDA